jgi:1-acyl-sn-glycerol-3-phosphate acyltransferase
MMFCVCVVYIYIMKIGMMSFIMSMCIALPVTLIPQQLLYKTKILTKVQSEKAALWTGQFCARWLLRIIPFCKVQLIPHRDYDPEPAIWVCNHQSMLDVFILLACDLELRGPKKRPIKIVYVSTT